MELSDIDKNTISILLKYEHEQVGKQLGFISKSDLQLNLALVIKAVGLIDKLSRSKDDKDKRIAITLIAIIWTYRHPEWEPIKDFFLLSVSRIGFSPSALMIDSDFDSSTRQYSPVGSIFDQVGIVCQQLQYEVNVSGQIFLLTEFQKNIWTKLDEFDLLGISAPTSAGKSFILILKCIDLLLQKLGDVVYIVPTLSLVSQVATDFKNMLTSFGMSDFEILTTFYEPVNNNHRIYVLTQEKAIAAFSQQEQPFTNLRFLIVDEIQNVERVAQEDDQRAKTLFDAIMEFRHTSNPSKIVISGPRIQSIGELGTTIFGVKANEESTTGSPVVNFTYAVSKIGTQYYLKQYCEIRKQPSTIPIHYAEVIEGHGGLQYSKQFHKYLSHIIQCFGSSSINVIFSPTSSQARRTALAITAAIQENVTELNSLIRYVSETVHPAYDLCQTLPKGLAYHHGKTPPHIRRVIEKAIREKWVKNIVCTTTLMQGVNLPAQTVIIRNPNLCIKARDGKRPKLTNYEIANLRGRAGRLLKDFIGRTFVLDENAFEETDVQTDLFEETTKEIQPGYGGKFIENEKNIIEDLHSSIPPNPDNEEYSYLLTYIRQTALKYGKLGLQRLQTVGISISETNYFKILNLLSSLKVPKSICYKNRYWDPIDLDLLYTKSNTVTLPSSVSEPNIAKKLFKLIKFMDSEFSLYTNKYFKVENDKLLISNCINTEKWLKEWPLNKILSTPYYDHSDKIEDTINLLQNAVSYGLPMLLKPLYDIKNDKNMFLRFIEMGSYKPITRRMIELNIPRETAIYLSNNFFGSITNNISDEDNYIRNRLKQIFTKLDFWNQVQLESIL